MHPQLESSLDLFDRLEASPIAIVAWDREMRVTHWSTRAAQLFGRSGDEVLGRHPREWPFAEAMDQGRWLESLGALLAGASTSRTEHLRHRCCDGRLIYCGWYSVAQLDADGAVASIFSVVIDETESREIEAKLQVQNERFAFALEAAQMGCWDWDAGSGNLTLFGSMDTLFGYDKGAFPIRPESVLTRIHPEDQARLASGFGAESLRGHQSVDVEYRVRMPNGTLRWLHSRGRAVFDETGRLVRITGTALDATERKRGEESLVKAKDTAETSSALKSAFVANMSHEIRTPLGVIMGFAELLSDPAIEAGERSYYMSIITRNGEHLSRLIDDILDLSKIEAGQLETQAAVMPLKATLGEVLSGLQARAFDKGVDLIVDQEGPVPDEIHTDPIRFKQVVGNLAGNALKFTEKGEVRVTVVCENSPERTLKIRVRDTGIGMSADGQKRLFAPFVQVDRPLTRGYGGTGLGLALSRRIARALGGDIVLVSSSLGVGSVFEFALPPSVFVSSPGETPAARLEEGGRAWRADTTLSLSGLRLLLAEDAQDVQVLMHRILTKRGASLTTVGDGEEAVRRALSGDFDVVLMDIQMPKVDGYEATQRLRRCGYSRPILALTAHAMKEERERCIAAGCNGHISKPVQTAELVEAILRFAGRGQGRTAAPAEQTTPSLH